MQCPGCQCEVLGWHFYCPDCRTPLRRTSGLSLTAQELTKIEPPRAPPSRTLPIILMMVAVGGLATAVMMTVTNINQQNTVQDQSLVPSSSVLAESFVNEPTTRRAANIPSLKKPKEEAAKLPASESAARELSKLSAKSEAAAPDAKPDAASAPQLAAPKAVAVIPNLTKEVEVNVEPLDASLDPRMGLLTIKSDARASVYVNGRFSGTTPLSLKLLTGDHTISLSADGYEDWSRKIQLRSRQRVIIQVPLSKK